MSVVTKQHYYKANRIQQLRGFYYTVQTGSVSKAADKMFLTQSTVSGQIKSLEENLGVALFERRGIKLYPTKEARSLYDMCMPLIEGIDNIYDKFVIEREKENERCLKVVCNHITSITIMPKLIKAYADILPKTKIILSNVSVNEGITRMIDDKADVMVGPMPKLPSDLEFYQVYEFKPVLIAKKGHPILKITKPKFKDLAKYPMSIIDKHLITLPTFVEIAEEYNYFGSASLEFENGDWIMLKAIVKTGYSTAMVLDMCIDESDKEYIGVLDVSHLFPKMKFGFTLKKDKYLLSHVQEFIKVMAPDIDIPQLLV